MDFDFWLGVLSYPGRRYTGDSEPDYNQVREAFDKFCTEKASKGLMLHERVPYIKKKKAFYPKNKKTKKEDVEIKQEENFREGVHVSLEVDQWWLDAMGLERPVYLGNVRRDRCDVFSMFYRFYAMSTTTGADYLYYYRSTHNKENRLHNKGSLQLLSRPETCGVLEMYLNNAYRMQKKVRTPFATCQEDLDLMQKFWTECYWGQDIILICLEIQQRFLYDHVRRQFLECIRTWQTAINRWNPKKTGNSLFYR
jgi:hypothetical protein